MRALALLCAVAALAIPAAAHAQSTPTVAYLEEFQSLCIANRTDPVATLAAADKAGWTEAPETITTQLAGKIKDPKVRIKIGQDGIQMLVLGVDSRKLAGVPLNSPMCGVMAGVTDTAVVAAKAKALSGGGEPIDLKGQGQMWVYDEAASGPKPLSVADLAAATAAIQAGRGRFVIMASYPAPGAPTPFTMLAYAIPAL